MAESRIAQEVVALGVIDVVKARGSKLSQPEAAELEALVRSYCSSSPPSIDQTDDIGLALDCLGRDDVDVQRTIHLLTAYVLKIRQSSDG